MIQTTSHRITATNVGRYNQTVMFDKVGDVWYPARNRRPMGKGLTQDQVMSYLINILGVEA